MMSSEIYDKVQYSYQGKHGLELIGKLPVLRGSDVLDLGCGTGYLTSVLADRVGREGKVTGVDPNRERIDIAKRKYERYGNLKFFDRSSADFLAGPYDIVFSNFVLHWIKDKESTFKRVYDNLKPDGCFAFLCPAKPPTSIWKELNPKIDEQLYYCTVDEYDSLAQQNGFEVPFRSIDIIQHDFESFDSYIEWMQASVNVAGHPIKPNKMKEIKAKSPTKPCMEWTRIVYIMFKVRMTTATQ